MGIAVGATRARADDVHGSCPDIGGPKCSIQLSTGITMRYLETGPDDGPVVFLLHGYTDTSRSLSRVMSALHTLSPELHIIDVDQRGHGDSSMPPGAGCPSAPASCFRPADFASDIIAFMDARRIQRATMAGHSMGSLVAQELALSYPRRVERLVLISTSTNGQKPPLESLLNDFIEGFWQPSFSAAGYAWPDGAYDVAPGVAVPGFDDFIRFAWVFSTVAPQSFLDQIIPETSATRVGTWLGALQNLVVADNTLRLQHLATPTLVLWAVQDSLFSRDDQQLLIDTLEVAADHGGSFWWKQYGVLPPPPGGEQTDFSHNVVWEAPDGIAGDMASYIEQGRPTKILYHTDYPTDVQRIVAEPGRATLIHAGGGD